MPDKSTIKWICITLIVAAGLIGGGFLLYHEFKGGEQVAAGKQATAQLKHNGKINGKFAKIDAQTPDPVNHDAAIDFLRAHTRTGQ